MQDGKKRGLFRAEALAHARAGGAPGTVLLAAPIRLKLVTLLSLIMVGAIVTFSASFEYTRTDLVRGVVATGAGASRVVAGHSGVVVKRLVREGEQVQAQQPLVEISVDGHLRGGAETQDRLGQILRQRLAVARQEHSDSQTDYGQRTDILRERLRLHEDELRITESQIALQQQRSELARKDLDKARQLGSAGFISNSQIGEKELALAEHLQKTAELQARIVVIRRAKATDEAELRELEARRRSDESALRQSILQLQASLEEGDGGRVVTVRAPQAGIVAALNVDAGLPVQAERSLAVIIPQDTPLAVNLYVPSRSIGLVKAGMPVWLRYQAYPYQRFGQHLGKVVEVALAPLAPRDLELADLPAEMVTGNSAEPLYRVRVSVPSRVLHVRGEDFSLAPGMLVDASLRLERRPLYQRLLDPVGAFLAKAPQ